MAECRMRPYLESMFEVFEMKNDVCSVVFRYFGLFLLLFLLFGAANL